MSRPLSVGDLPELGWMTAQTLHLRKMTFVEGCHDAPALKGSGGHNQVIRTYSLAGTLQPGPDTRMVVRRLFRVGNDRERRYDRLKISLPLHLWLAEARSTPCQSSATVIAVNSNCSFARDANQPWRSKTPFSPLMITLASRIIAIYPQRPSKPGARPPDRGAGLLIHCPPG